jgi:hypothetical protein
MRRAWDFLHETEQVPDRYTEGLWELLLGELRSGLRRTSPRREALPPTTQPGVQAPTPMYHPPEVDSPHPEDPTPRLDTSPPLDTSTLEPTTAPITAPEEGRLERPREGNSKPPTPPQGGLLARAPKWLTAKAPKDKGTSSDKMDLPATGSKGPTDGATS